MTVKSRYLVSAAAVALTVAFLAPVSHADCAVNTAFGQVGINGYTYTFMPSTSTNSQTSIIGKFWSVGNFAGDNSGTGCPDDAWFAVCDATHYACGGNPTGKTRYINGAEHGSVGGRPFCIPTGCVGDEQPTAADMNMLLQDVSTDGQHAFFALGRVTGTPTQGVAYDYTRVANISLVEIPRPFVNSSSRAGTTINLNVNLNAANTGFVGLGGQTAQGPGNISGFRVMTFTGTADPGRTRTNGWVADAVSRPYTGSAVNIPTFGVNCSNTTQDVFVALALEFDAGAVTTDYVSQAVRVECDPTIADPQRFRSLDKPSGVQKAPPKH